MSFWPKCPSQSVSCQSVMLTKVWFSRSYNRKKVNVLGLCKADVTWIVGPLGWTLFKRSQETCKNPRSCLDFSDPFYWIWVVHNNLTDFATSRNSWNLRNSNSHAFTDSGPIKVDLDFASHFWVFHFLVWTRIFFFRFQTWESLHISISVFSSFSAVVSREHQYLLKKQTKYRPFVHFELLNSVFFDQFISLKIVFAFLTL